MIPHDRDEPNSGSHEAFTRMLVRIRIPRLTAIISVVATVAIVFVIVISITGNWNEKTGAASRAAAHARASAGDFVSMGNYPSTTSYIGGELTLSPPPSAALTGPSQGGTAIYRSTASSVFSAYISSQSPVKTTADELGYVPSIYKATLTDHTYGEQSKTGKIVPTFDNTPVWVIVYKNVEWPNFSSKEKAGDQKERSAVEDVLVVYTSTGSSGPTFVLTPPGQ